ncbi:hypothetical protein Pfo_010156 [Paulownia fortunei]|nr:hypothetical protein Pfo_010156 [Paulownia fortunei]
MGTEPLLNFEPSELSFSFELNKQLSSSIRLLNKTQNHLAFKLLTTNPRNYGVRPRIGILLPGSACDITVTARVVREAPHNMRCKDKFMIQSAVASPGATMEDARKMFNKEAGHVFQECKLQVVYSKPTESSFGVSVMENSNSNVPEVTNHVVEPHDNVLQMSTRKLLHVQPRELQFPLSLNKELSCSLQLSNVTENQVAFKVKNVSPKYLVQPNIGILLPQSTYNITVRIAAQSKIPSDIQSEDKFLIQSVVAPAAATKEDIILDMFDKARSPIEEYELQLVYISKQENNSNRIVALILRCLIISLLGLVSCYLMKQTLSLIWSLTMVAIMLMIKMIKKLVSDSVEDWIVKTLLHIFMHLFGHKDNIRLS